LDRRKEGRGKKPSPPSSGKGKKGSGLKEKGGVGRRRKGGSFLLSPWERKIETFPF